MSDASGELSGSIALVGWEDRNPPSHVTAALDEVARLPGVEKAVLLVDAHLKEKYVRARYKAAVPSSTVVVSSPELLYPQLRSLGIGCGMMLVGTGLTAEDAKGVLGRRLRGIARYLLVGEAVDLPDQPQCRRSLTMSAPDMLQMCLGGAPWVAREFRLPPGTVEGFFQGGSFLSEVEAASFSWDGFGPQWMEGKQRDGRWLGLDLGGNHFLEAQVVEEVPDSEGTLCLRKGELAFLYHGSCNGLAAVIHPELVPNLVESGSFRSYSPADWEYGLVLRAVKALMNWSAAARCLVLVRLRSLLARLFPDVSLDGFRCVSEAPHNSILLEEVDGVQRIVYRHNAVPIVPGRPILVSGRNDHASYLFLPGAATDHSLNSLDHGIGAILDRMALAAGADHRLTSQRVVRRYVRDWDLWESHERFALINPSVTEPLFLQPYQREGVIQAGCYRLRPFVTLKRAEIPVRSLVRRWVKGLGR